MNLHVKQMNYEEAKQILKWSYQSPYSIYSMEESDSCLNELLSGLYFSVTNKEGCILGYLCYGEAAQVPAGNEYGVYKDRDLTDIGLGIKPDLCGNGLGVEFLNAGLNFARKELSSRKFRLTVAAFNHRAIKVYERTGFKTVSSFKRNSGVGEMEFLVMLLY